MRAICPAYLILLDEITQVIFGEQFRQLSSPLYSFLHSSVTLSLLDQNILLSTPFSNTVSLHTSINMSDQVLPYTKQQAKL
jgi:hypothetical protein